MKESNNNQKPTPSPMPKPADGEGSGDSACSVNLLHMTLKRQWFDMILSGEKKEEYRELKEYWITRLSDPSKGYTHIKFRNGYSKECPWMIVELKEITSGYGKPRWGCPVSECIILKLGEVISSNSELTDS
ncbi:MAG: ASCH domain-containing protein [Akkermansiaceae bacterium]